MNELELLLHQGSSGRRLPLPAAGEGLIVGRSPDAWASVDEPTVAYEHALIRTTDTGASVENLASGGTLLNGRRLMQPESLAVGDEIRLSEATWILVVAAKGQPKRRSLVPLAIIASLALCGGAWVALRSPPPPSRNDIAAFAELERWLDAQAAGERVPQSIAAGFREAWRLEKAGRFVDAERAWAQSGVAASVCVTDDASGRPRSWSQLAAEQPKALEMFATTKGDVANVGDAVHAAAIVQFAVESAAYAGRRAAAVKARR